MTATRTNDQRRERRLTSSRPRGRLALSPSTSRPDCGRLPCRGCLGKWTWAIIGAMALGRTRGDLLMMRCATVVLLAWALNLPTKARGDDPPTDVVSALEKGVADAI